MNRMIRIIFIGLVIIVSHAIDGLRRRCLNTGILFPDKVSHSPLIVYGESLAKRIYADTETELLFNVTFRVNCIFKGEVMEDRIEITEAGIKNNRTACQWLDAGKVYVVFLDKCSTNGSLYCPMDFQERLVDDITLELLEKTCRLKLLRPLNAISNNCPNVSMGEFCSNEEIEIKIKPKSKHFDEEHLTMNPRQSNITLFNEQSLVNHISDNPHSHADLSAFASISILILAVVTAMFM